MADVQKLNVNNTTYDISTTWGKVTGKPSTFPPESHTHSYLPLSGGTMSNQNVVVNLNADLLDGYSGSAYAKKTDLSSYLPLSGGTVTGIIKRNSGGSWISGRDNVIVMQTKTNPAGSSWNPVIGVKTQTGCWTMGSVGGEGLQLSYDTDTDYNSDNNTSSVIQFPSAGSSGTLALTSQIPSTMAWSAITGKPSTFAPSSHTHDDRYYTESEVNTKLSGKSDTGHTHNYLPLSGGTLSGSITMSQPSSDRRVGIIGTYDPNRAAAIWSMGSSYQLATDGLSFGSLYGAAYAYYGSGYTFGAGKSGGHSFVWCQAGSPTSALGDNVWTSGGFIKNGSSNSYVLLGGGGHKAESSLSVNYANSAGSAGSVAWGNVSGKPSFFTPARYGTTSTHSYYKIKINSTTSWMLAFNVRVYKSYSFFDIRFSGYNYGYNYWYSPVASLTDGDSAITVYFGYDSAWNLWVAIPGGNYTGIEITNVCNGYTQVIGPDLSSLFTISAVYSLSGTIQSTQTIQPPSRSGHTHSGYASSSHSHNYLPLTGGTVSGTITATGFYQSSDERLKTFHNPIKVDLEKLKTLRKNYFKFSDKDKLEIGISAQEIQNLYPEIVSSDDNGYLSVAYDKLSVIALSAIDELDDNIKELRQENNDLKDQLEAIKNILKEKGIL